MAVHSITSRITGLMFLAIFITVFILVYLANYQMAEHFQHYLDLQQTSELFTRTGTAEQLFLESIHRSLYWVGGIILIIGLLASFLVARSITVPIRKLGEVVDAVGAGMYGRKVEFSSRSELGKLAKAFNGMSESLAESTRLRQRLLADIVHELRTPMSVIQGNIEGMLEGVIDRSNENLSSLHEEVIYVNRMITDLRDLSLAEAGQLSLDKECTDLNALVGRALNMLEPLAGEKDILVNRQIEKAPEIFIDPRRFNQIIYNLMTNAIRYTPAGGTIKVGTLVTPAERPQWLELGFADSGCGISPEDLPYVFDHFYRADKSRQKKSGGSGIGLAIVKRLVELHGGSVKVCSRLGEGSEFTVVLPL